MNKLDKTRDYPMLKGRFTIKGYDWWWHNFTGINEATGEERTFYVEYFTCNPALAYQNGGMEPVLGQSKEAKENGWKPSYLMVKAGWWGNKSGTKAVQLHNFYSWTNTGLCIEKDGYHVYGPELSASETLLTGKVKVTPEMAEAHPEYMCTGGEMEWNVTVDKKVAFNVGYGAGKLFRALTAFEMYWHAQGMKTLYSGYVIADGQKFTVKPETCYGYADKNWGADFTSPWVWISSWDLKSRITGERLNNSVFDIGGGRPKAFGIALNRKLLSDFWYEGKSYEFNFSKFWTFCRTTFECKETETQIIWYVKQKTLTAQMETRLFCDKDKMLLVNYEAPDGQKRHNRLWNGGNGYGTVRLYKKARGKLQLLDEVEVLHAGCEWGEYTL